MTDIDRILSKFDELEVEQAERWRSHLKAEAARTRMVVAVIAGVALVGAAVVQAVSAGSYAQAAENMRQVTREELSGQRVALEHHDEILLARFVRQLKGPLYEEPERESER